MATGYEVGRSPGNYSPAGQDLSAGLEKPAATGSVARTLAAHLGDAADVMDYGATGNGTTDDTAAIQAAINSFASPGGRVYFPPGTYKITGSGLTLQLSTSLIGAGAGDTSTATPTIIDGTGITNGLYYAITIPNSARGNLLQGFSLRGALTSTSARGIYTQSAEYVTIRDVDISGFYEALNLSTLARSLIDQVRTNLTWFSGVVLTGGSSVTIRNCYIANANHSGANGSNAGIYCINCSDIDMYLSEMDESGAGAATIRLANTQRALIECGLLYYSTLGAGGGRGIQVDSNCSEVTIRGCHIKGFSANPTGATIDLAGTNHRLQNIVTEPQGGTDIIDASTGTVWLNVNGVYKVMNLPTADPGAGSKQLWCDTTDSNRVKFRT